jgi:cytidylate kinase
MTLALYGRTCTGKSTIAKLLGNRLDCPVHGVGEIVRARSAELGTAPRGLSLEEHHTIDKVIGSIVKLAGESVVVEGAFLDALLGDLDGVYRVKLTCGDEERRSRFDRRVGASRLEQRDEDDDNLRHALHGGKLGCADVTFDTTSKTADQVAEEIIQWLSTKTA